MADDQFSGKFPPWLANYRWPLTYEGRYGTSIFPGTIRNHTPNSRQQLVNYLNDTFYDGGRKGDAYAENIAKILDFPLGAGHGSYEVTRAIAEDRPGDAAISLAMAATPPPVKKIGKEAIKTIKDAFRRRERSIPNAEPGHVSQAALESKGTIVPEQSGPAAPSIIRPDNHLVTPKPSIILPGTRPVVPSTPVIQAMHGPHDWIDEVKFEESDLPGGRSIPWVVPYGPLAKAPRNSSLDYPNGVDLDEHGRIRYDIEGRKLSAPVIAGRQRLGQKDVPITSAQIRHILKELGVPVLRVPRDNLRGIGRYDPIHWKSPGRIYIWDRLPDDQADVILGHEFAHLADRKLGYPRVYGLGDELDLIYSENMTGQLNPPRRIHPRDNNYTREEYRREKMAEAVRTQLFQPNTIKTIAPKTAALLRKRINEHPILSKYLQANGIPIGILAAAGTTAMVANPSETQAKQIDPHDAATVPDVKLNLRKIVSALPAAIRRKPIPGTIDLIAGALSGRRTRPSYGGPR